MSGFLKKIQKAAFIIIGLMGIYIFTSAFRIASEDGGLLIVTQICQSVKNNISKNIISTYFPAFNYAMGERTGEILNSDELTHLYIMILLSKKRQGMRIILMIKPENLLVKSRQVYRMKMWKNCRLIRPLMSRCR